MIWLIGLGGIAGTFSRFYLGRWLASGGKAAGFPWGTWVINITGSFILGALFSLHAQHEISDTLWLVAGTGFCGAYTTFSTFGFETCLLALNGEKGKAGVYAASSVLLGLLFAYLGMELFSSFA
ncbi:fluoride efflux transporter CrcB [Paenibacillus humicola]|uniref:fluoride efflux transporter CrcB n=1 Tax=Paenibacillus humicola TaxID=3110540 RepID=UPI00237BF6BD|nr:fluoride efflux transporter CrcB [Paenibacillus humicola]